MPLFQKVISEGAELGIKNAVLHTHGKSLLHPKIAEMINFAKKKGLTVSVTTNGTALNKDLSKALLDSGLDI